MKKVRLGLLVLTILCAETIALAEVIVTAGAVPCGEIWAPESGVSLLADTKLTPMSINTYDEDTYDYGDGYVTTDIESIQGDYIEWIASHGTFPNGNTTSSASWRAPPYEQYDIEIALNLSDEPVAGSFDDPVPPNPADVIYVNSIVPNAMKVSFGDHSSYGDNEHDIYDVDDPVWERVFKNDPVSYTKGTKESVNLYFEESHELIGSTDVHFMVVDDEQRCFGWVYNREIENDSSSPHHVKGWTGPIESQWNLYDFIYKMDQELYWFYRVPAPAGTNTWIAFDWTPTGPHPVYTVWDCPGYYGAGYLYNEEYLDICVDWAEYCTKVDVTNDADNIPRQVQLKAKEWHGLYGYGQAGQKADPFEWIREHAPEGGDCATYASLMTVALEILGVDAETKIITASYAGADHSIFPKGVTPYYVDPNNDCDSDGTLNKLEFGYDDIIYPNNWPYPDYANGKDESAGWRTANQTYVFHGASECIGHWWEITFDSTPDHQTESVMSSIGGPVIEAPGPSPVWNYQKL